MDFSIVLIDSSLIPSRLFDAALANVELAACVRHFSSRQNRFLLQFGFAFLEPAPFASLLRQTHLAHRLFKVTSIFVST